MRIDYKRHMRQAGLADAETPILEDACQRERRAETRWMAIGIACALAYTSSPWWPWPAIAVAGFGIPLVIAVAMQCKHMRDASRYRAERRRRVGLVPWRLQAAAMRLYGDGWMSAAIECDEAHLPGDCPLCGAVEGDPT